MKAEWKNSSIVKALLNGGFDEEYIEKAIENGDIILEKSKTEKEMEHSSARAQLFAIKIEHMTGKLVNEK